MIDFWSFQSEYLDLYAEPSPYLMKAYGLWAY